MPRLYFGFVFALGPDPVLRLALTLRIGRQYWIKEPVAENRCSNRDLFVNVISFINSISEGSLSGR